MSVGTHYHRQDKLPSAPGYVGADYGGSPSDGSGTAAASLAGLAGLYSGMGANFVGANFSAGCTKLPRGAFDGSGLGGALGNLAAAAGTPYDAAYNQKFQPATPVKQHSIDGILGRREDKDTNSDSRGKTVCYVTHDVITEFY